jgi:hypothetical protein
LLLVLPAYGQSQATPQPARPLTATGLRNLTAFAKLYGLVRFFHASDEAAAADWNRFAIEGVRALEAPASEGELARALEDVFAPVAPTVRVYIGERPPLPDALSPQPGLRLIRCRNHGVGLRSAQTIYRSTRVESPADTFKPDDVYLAELTGSVKALVPLALFTGEGGTRPVAAKPAEPRGPVPAWALSGNDRAIRLADVVIAWNVFRHFYPYFDVAGTDWNAQLPALLGQAAIDPGELAFHRTLQKMVAALQDGHGNVMFGGAPASRLPVTAVWIENKLVVTGVYGAATEHIRPGDEIAAIDGKPAKAALEEAETWISGATPQWKRYRAENEVMLCPPNQTRVLSIRRFGAADIREVRLEAGGKVPPRDARPAEIVTEVAPGVWYFDLTRARDADFMGALPSLKVARAIVFDMRGYPRLSAAWFSYVTETPLKSAQWHIPQVDRPGEMVFQREGEWTLTPKQTYLAARKIWLTDGEAISYAETTMGIIEAYKLGDIGGETTAGTNGNVNPFELPGGYTISWTGMKVLKHDGTRHHGVGIAPTIPAQRTQAGVAADRDEVLEKALSLVK